jgi:hypothetical protein
MTIGSIHDLAAPESIAQQEDTTLKDLFLAGLCNLLSISVDFQ